MLVCKYDFFSEEISTQQFTYTFETQFHSKSLTQVKINVAATFRIYNCDRVILREQKPWHGKYYRKRIWSISALSHFFG